MITVEFRFFCFQISLIDILYHILRLLEIEGKKHIPELQKSKIIEEREGLVTFRYKIKGPPVRQF